MKRSDKYTAEVQQVITNAREEARSLNVGQVGNEHLLLGILQLNNQTIEAIFAAQQANTERVMQALRFVVRHGSRAIVSQPTLNPATRATLARAQKEARKDRAELVRVEHLFIAIFGDYDGLAVGVLEGNGITINIVRQHLAAVNEGYEHLQRAMNYQALYDATPTLNSVSRDLTIAALTGELQPIVGREEEFERTMQILSRRTKNNPALIGPAGVGKTTIAEALALHIVQGRAPEHLLDCRVVSLSLGLLPVGTRFRGDFEERLKAIIQEIKDSPGIILVIDELHLLTQSGVSEGSLDAASLLKPLLARGELRCIGTTTLDDYRKTIETDPALERRFQPVLVQETDSSATLAILEGVRKLYEDFHQVTITDEALKTAVRLSSRYIQDRYQPDKALDLMDEAASRGRVERSVTPEKILVMRDELVKIRREKEYAINHRDFHQASVLLKQERKLDAELEEAEHQWQRRVQEQMQTKIEADDVARIVSAWTGIPVMHMTRQEERQLLHLEETLHQRVVGQHEAVQAIARAIRRARTDLRDQRRPIGSFLFVGPTGVGKTELARALAESLFGDEEALLKLDMSEFMESHNISRLVGAPPGYRGYDHPGQLTEAVRRRPYSVVLFDEIEKAHPKVFDLLLQVLEDGRLTDARGQQVDFRNTVIILTSNVGTAQLSRGAIGFLPDKQNAQEQAARAYEHARSKIMPAVRHLFRPELFNRIDEVIVFHSLEQNHLRRIVDLLVEQTQQRLQAQSIQLSVSAAARQRLVAIGTDPAYGARHLRRAVQRTLEDMLAEAILSGTVTADQKVQIDLEGERLSISVSQLATVSAA